MVRAASDAPSSERLLLMARKLYRFMLPLAVLALATGLWLWLGYGVGRGPGNGWLHAKLALVLLLVGYHHGCGRLLRGFERGRNRRSHRWYRLFNEVPVLLPGGRGRAGRGQAVLKPARRSNRIDHEDHRLLLLPLVALDLPRPPAPGRDRRPPRGRDRVLPVDLGGRIFPGSGGLPLAQRAPQRQAYRLVELRRWAELPGRAAQPAARHFPTPGHDAARLIILAHSGTAARPR